MSLKGFNRAMTKKELNAIIKFQSEIQDRLMLLVEAAYRFYEPTWFGLGKSKSTKTYEDGLFAASEVINDFLVIWMKKVSKK